MPPLQCRGDPAGRGRSPVYIATGPECGICLRPHSRSDPGWPGCGHPFHGACPKPGGPRGPGPRDAPCAGSSGIGPTRALPAGTPTGPISLGCWSPQSSLQPGPYQKGRGPSGSSTSTGEDPGAFSPRSSPQWDPQSRADSSVRCQWPPDDPDTISRVGRVTVVAVPGWRWPVLVRMVVGPNY